MRLTRHYKRIPVYLFVRNQLWLELRYLSDYKAYLRIHHGISVS
jgi:hypothetical protein